MPKRLPSSDHKNEKSTLDVEAVELLFKALPGGYQRHKEVGSNLQERLDAVFFEAANFFDYEFMEKTLKLGANINTIQEGIGATASHIAVGRQSKELLEFLLEHNARMDIYNKNLVTPLDDAWRQARITMEPDFAMWLERAWREKHPSEKSVLSTRFGL